METNDNFRVILAVATGADDTTKFIWDRLKVIQADMFAVGPVHIKFAYFGREGASSIRPCITTNWITNADDMRDIMDRGRAGCVCGCYLNVGDILQQAVQEAQRAPVQAVVIVGDYFHGDLDHALATAKQLHALGTRLFLFQQDNGRSGSSEETFRMLAEVTGGAYFHFNPQIERVAERLPGMLETLTRFAVGGMQALEIHAAEDDGSAVLLLEQMANKDVAQIAEG
jgi:hypothetical protein